jgi:hypothetical protein
MSVGSALSQQAAKDFALRQYDSLTQDVVYLVTTDTLLYSNDAMAQLNELKDYDAHVYDSLMERYVRIDGKISDSIIISQFKSTLIAELENMGLKVVPVKASELPDSLSSGRHTLNIAQLEVEEFVTQDSIWSDENGKAYSYRVPLNGVSFNAWFFYDEKDTANRLTLFSNEVITDGLQGNITYNNDKAVVKYHITRINPNDAYSIACITAKNSAIYFYNLLLNKYVFNATKGEDKSYYGIDYDSGNILTDDEPFDNFDVIPN